jgi:hypothetical protein
VCTTYCTIDAELVPIGQPIEGGGEDETALFEHDLANEIICHAPVGHLPNVGSTAAWQAVTAIGNVRTQVVRPHHRVVEEHRFMSFGWAVLPDRSFEMGRVLRVVKDEQDVRVGTDSLSNRPFRMEQPRSNSEDDINLAPNLGVPESVSELVNVLEQPRADELLLRHLVLEHPTVVFLGEHVMREETGADSVISSPRVRATEIRIHPAHYEPQRVQPDHLKI